MPITFHADLHKTRLEVFVEHVNAGLPDMSKWSIPNSIHLPSGALMMWVPPLEMDAKARGLGLEIHQGVLFGVPNPEKVRAEVELSKYGIIERKWMFYWYQDEVISTTPFGLADQVDADGKITPLTSITLPSRFTVSELRATEYHDNKIRVTVSEHEGKNWAQHLRAWLEPRWGKSGTGFTELDPKLVPTAAEIQLPQSPPIPGTSDFTWDDLFDWWYRGGILFGYHTLKDLALKLPHAKGTVGNHHAMYLDEFGKNPMPDSKSKFVGLVPIVIIDHEHE